MCRKAFLQSRQQTSLKRGLLFFYGCDIIILSREVALTKDFALELTLSALCFLNLGYNAIMRTISHKKIIQLLPGVKKNVPLAQYTSFRIGGKAKYFLAVKSKDELIEAVKTAKKIHLPFFIFGGGSNLLVSDKGFKGLVIKVQNTRYKILNTNIFAEAGVLLGELIRVSAEKNLSGLEWATGIPGTIGGAVFGNAGSFGRSMKDIIAKVEVLNSKDLKIKTYDSLDLQFAYRESIFKKKKNLVIVSVTITLQKGDKLEIQKKMKDFMMYKKNSQPLDFFSAGSVFKNPSLTLENLVPFGDKNPETVSAGALIEKCGLKNKKIGGAGISGKHANFIVNIRKAKSKDVQALIKLIKKKVKEKFKITLQEEIRYL